MTGPPDVRDAYLYRVRERLSADLQAALQRHDFLDCDMEPIEYVHRGLIARIVTATDDAGAAELDEWDAEVYVRAFQDAYETFAVGVDPASSPQYHLLPEIRELVHAGQ